MNDVEGLWNIVCHFCGIPLPDIEENDNFDELDYIVEHNAGVEYMRARSIVLWV